MENHQKDKMLKAVVAARQPGHYISGVNQPRDFKGKFRQILGRLKQDLGESGLQNVVEKVQKAENLDNAGNYVAAVQAAQDLIGVLNQLNSGSLNPQALENIRSSARSLGQVISNLPLPFSDQTEKVRYSDLPPVLRNLMEDMMKRVEEKIGKDDATIANSNLADFKAGGKMFSQSDISSEMSTMLRLLT